MPATLASTLAPLADAGDLAAVLPLTERAEFLIDCLDLPAAAGVPAAVWEKFQIEHLCDDGLFRIERKSRQIAWSFTTAAEAIADAILAGRDSVFVSIQQEEAAEKIRYAKAVLANLDVAGLPTVKRDNTFGLEFSTGARLSSLPSRPPRGRARSNLYYDEFAHIANDRQIYAAGLPVISKGGRIRIGSSPFGATGLFWEIDTETIRQYPGYTRAITSWFDVTYFCNDPAAAGASALAGDPIAERVRLFGTARIREIYDNIDEDQFAQEYEGTYIDEAASFHTWQEIAAATVADLVCEIVTCTGTEIASALAAIETTRQRMDTGEAELAFAAGIDIGRKRDATEITLIGMDHTDTRPARLLISLHKTPYREQAAVIDAMMRSLPVARCYIDSNGIGSQLAEDAELMHPGAAFGYTFSNPSKAAMATLTKKTLQLGQLQIPADRDLRYQMHAIKRGSTNANATTYESDRSEKHHADKYWALALALTAAKAVTGIIDPLEIWN